MKHVCPKCGTPVVNANAHGVTFVAATGVVTYDGRTCRLRPIQIDILEALLDAYPNGIRIAELFSAIYPDGEADDRNKLAVTVSQMRGTVDAAGMRLKINHRSGWGDRREYYIVLGDASEEQQTKVA